MQSYLRLVTKKSVGSCQIFFVFKSTNQIIWLLKLNWSNQSFWRLSINDFFHNIKVNCLHKLFVFWILWVPFFCEFFFIGLMGSVYWCFFSDEESKLKSHTSATLMTLPNMCLEHLKTDTLWNRRYTVSDHYFIENSRKIVYVVFI